MWTTIIALHLLLSVVTSTLATPKLLVVYTSTFDPKVHRWTAHFLFAQGVAKLITFIFWVGTYMELNVKKHPTRQYMGYWVLFVQGAQLLLMADFLIQYMKCVRLGVSVSEIMNVV